MMKRFLSLWQGDVGKTLALTVGSPSAHRRGTMLKPLFLAMLFLIAGIGQVWAEDELCYTLTPATGSNNGYASGCDVTISGITWNVTGNATLTPWRIGGKSISSVDRTVYSKTAMSDAITKVELIVGAASNITVNSVKLIVASDAAFETQIDAVTKTFAANSTITFTPTSPATNWATAAYYKFVFNVTVSGNNNKFVEFSSAKFYREKNESAPVLTSLTINGDLDDKEYEEGQELDFSGLTVTGTYSDSSTDDVTDDVEWSFTPALAVGTSSYAVTATIGEISDSKEITDVIVTEHVVTPGEYTINLTNTLFGTTADANITAATSAKQNDITLTINGSGTKPRTDASYVRFYNNSTLQISVPTGYNITKIVITSNQSDYSAPSVNVGEFDTSTKTWTSKSNEVVWSFSAKSFIGQIKVTYAAIAPEVTVDPEELSFTAKQNIAVDGKTFTLEGANLTSAPLALAASTGFSVSPTEITAEDAMAQGGVEVTVTPATPTAATTPVEGTVTISGGGLASNVVVNLSMAVTPTYAVEVAVNDNAMGSATINGGTATVYAEYAEEVTLVASANPGYEFVNWTASTEDIDLGEDAAKANGAVAVIGAAGTITANFKAQACTGLAAPVLDAVTKTYQSATIAWLAVDNADGYVLNIVKHEGGVAVLTDEVIVAPAVSFEKTGLEANTQYDYTVMAVGDGTAYCDESNPTLAGSFTTSDYPAATLSLVENGGTPYNLAGSHKLNDVVTLPNTLQGLGCTGKVLVGWDADENCATAPTYAKGADYTIASTADVLYAVFATEQEQAGSEHSVFATTSLGSTNTVTSGFAVSAQAESKSGYYQDGSGTTRYVQVKVSTAETQIIPEAPTAITVKAKIGGGTTKDPLTNNVYAVLIDADQNAIGDPVLLTTKVTAATGSDFEASMPIANYANVRGARVTHEKESGYNVRYYAISLSYTTGGGVSYSGYTTECDAQLPKLDAPEFPVAEGVFYESTDITISAADGASIYYTTDGTTPSSTNGTLYEGAITLNAYGTYNFKAIAVQAGHEDSEVAEATYYFGMTFASVSDLYTYLEANSLTSLNNVKVTGLVSRITTAWDAQKGYLTYYISDNGQTTSDLQMYRGAGEGASALAVGDQVTVTGNYTLFQSTTHEFGAGNTIVARTAATIASVEIGGTAEKTTYSPEDNVFSRTGLTATATYNTGYTKDVTADATWTNNLTNNIVTETGNVEVTATYAELSDTKEVAVTYTAKTLDHITLSYTSTTAYVGMALPTPTVTASYVEDIADEDVTELVAAADGFDTESAYNGSAAGSYTINVSYTLGTETKTAEYTVTVKSIYNAESDPYTVVEALDIIGANFNTTTASPDSIVVAGIVSRLDGTYVNTYWISDDGTENNELEVYSGKYLGKATFTTANQLHVGDEVVVKGKVKTYNNTKEFDSNSRLVSLARTPNFEVADVAEALEVNISEDLGVEGLTITKDGEGEVTLTSSDETKVSIVDGKLHAVAAAENVEITANLAASGIYKAATTTFHVTVIAERARYTVTFDANGGEGSDPEAIADQLAGAPVDMPAACLYNYEGHGFTGWKVINLSTSKEIAVENDQFEMPAANVKIQAQWAGVATCRISFQVNGSEVAYANAPQEADYNISQVGAEVPGFTFLGWSETEYADEVENAPTLINVYHAQAGENSKVLYGIYKRVEGAGETNHYVLDYTEDGIGDLITASYGNAVNVTAKDGSQWVVKAYKNSGMQINTGKNASIKIPNCPGNIVSIGITCSAAKAVGLSAADYSGSGTITYVVSGSDATSQTLDFTGKTATAGYIVAKSGSTAITHIDVAYSAEVTYYTSSPVEKVTVTFDWDGGDGGCQTTKINKGSEFTICAEVPTKSHSEFAGWKLNETTTIYQANQNIGEVEEDITLTAQWNEADKYTVTYAKGGDDVTGAVPEDATEYFAGDQVTVLGQGGLEKSGYEFQGWLNGNKLHAAGAKFAMPAANVTLTAQWRKENIAQVASEKMTLITDASGLINGTVVALGCNYGENSFAMAGEISNKVMTSVTDGVSLSNGIATFTSSVVMMIAEQVGEGWTLRKDAENYLQETKVKELAWGTVADATVWTISFNNGNAVIASGNNTMKFNKDYPRFTTYASGQTAIQLFGKAMVVAAENETPVEVSISDLGYVEEGQNIVASGDVTLTIDVPTDAQSITAKDGATVVIDQATTAENVVVEEGSKIVANAETTTPTVYFATTMGVTDNNGDFHSTASELGSVTNITLADGGEIIYDLTLGTSKAGVQADPNQWHAFSLPFAVDAINGIYDAETGAKLENEVNYAIMDYHGDFRANGQYGWKKYRGILQPGVFYLMTVDGATKTFRFKAAKVGVMTQTNTMSAQAYDGAGEESDKGWNGFGNPRWIEGTFAYNAQYLDPYTYEYVTITPGMTIPVGLPFFYKAATTSDVSMGEVGASYAPARNKAYEIKNVAIRFGNEVSKDKLYISASEDALNEYEQDKDLVKMFMSQTPKVARISGNAYGMKLAMVNTPLVNDNAEVALTLYAPAAGEYTISAQEVDGYNVYLVREGAVIWNLSTSEYTADFAKGNNAGYGIRIIKAPKVTTDMENVFENASGAQKVIIDEHVFILRGENLYDVNGKLVK